ncbi:hypothetical protein KCP78_14130 [Salmonella enterica subsp. enterica]|nr:hypothetical protein KCP78_14130 [Salmonella enterica subsp. enterica]
MLKRARRNSERFDAIPIPGGFGYRGVEGKSLLRAMRVKTIFLSRYLPGTVLR